MTLLHGEALQELRALPDCSIDSVVTDPPYGLAFMGKRWDYDVPGVEIWAECLRVLKPGGHLLAFAGTRTQHRMAVRIEDAGFEIRDMIAWVYGSGFPKSLDVSKAIDKARRRDYVLAAVEFGLNIPGNNLHDWTKGEHSPGDKWWEEFKRVLSPEQWGEIERAVVWKSDKGKAIFGSCVGEYDITAPATDAARQWDGWGTALKPALEPITVARKPLEGTVAENVQQWGTGALNVDGCRVETNDGRNRARPPRTANKILGGGKGTNLTASEHNAAGRWPANLIHDGSWEVLELFPETAPSKKAKRGGTNPNPMSWSGSRQDGQIEKGHDDNGGSAARFFYCAKASKSERGPGNTHPTVKPLALMRYLVRLVTPPGGTVLDPFMGSGTTGLAAAAEGSRFVGIERDEAYFEIARRRLTRENARG